MSGVKFKSIVPKRVPKPSQFTDAFRAKAAEMMADVVGSYMDATEGWKHQPELKASMKVTRASINIRVSTTDKIFGYVDLGIKAHIIRPVKAKVLHWQDTGGNDHFATIVHHPGFSGRKITESIQQIWIGLMPDYFDDAIRQVLSL